MYLITGSTGNVGSALVKVLIEQGHDVRGLVRSAARADDIPKGVDIAVGDLDDPGSIDAAVRGVDGVFLMQADAGTDQTHNMINAMRAADVNQVVLLSSIGTRLIPHPMIGAGLAAREEVLRQSGLDVTYLRPNALMSNALWWADGIRQEGRVIDATGPGRMPCVDPHDIARVAAVALVEDGHADHGYILNGPEALTSRDQVEIIAEVAGRHIDFEDVTPEQYAKHSIERGTPVPMAEAVQNLNELFRAGRAGVITDDIENLTGHAPGTFREWCARHVEAFQ